ncbi:MAG: tRNA preQ1(34) S-adenosylmethionine ribosyltransferase-isomerase QueA [Gammaproteobacteria bacterium]
MQLSDFYFDLPTELIAQYPLAKRTDSRLMVVNKHQQRLEHRYFPAIMDYVEPGDLIVLNNTRVIPARLYGRKASGGKVEMLLERVLDQQRALFHIRASKAPKLDTLIIITEDVSLKICDRQSDLFVVESVLGQSVLSILQEHGHTPLPPYIDRQDGALDQERYQTVYAKYDGAVAAPTAGLHFDENILTTLQKRGILIDYITLHVGAGTFQPVRTAQIERHQMHSEYIEVSANTCDKIRAVKQAGKRVVAVGTTVVRSLETAARNGFIAPYQGDTDIFIYPGYRFNCVDSLLTNFHLPESTLIMLVCAFAGYDTVMDAYRVAVEQRYRFFSYGDAMFLTDGPT